MPPNNARIRLLFSLSAALPFSESSGHPVFSWRASLPCGHLLGLLFRALGGRVEEVEDVEEEEEDGEGATEEVAGEVGVGENPPQQTYSSSPPPPRQQPSTAGKPERVRSARLEQKREKYLRRRQQLSNLETRHVQSGLERGSPDSGVSEGGQADTREVANGEDTLGGGPVERVAPVEQGERGLIVRPPPGAGIAGSRELYRESKDVTEEAAATLRNISTNFLSSLKYKKVSGCEREVRCLMGADLVTRGEDSATELAVRCNQLQRLAKAGKEADTKNI